MPEAPAVPPPQGENPNPGTGINEPEHKTVSYEEFDKLRTEYAYLRRKMEKSQQVAPAAKIEAEPDEAKTQRQKIEELQATVRKDRERLEKKVRRNGIREAIAENGVTDPDAIEVLFDHVESKHGSKIKVSEDDQTSYEDDVSGDVKTVSALIGDILKSPKGKYFKPEKAPGPSTRGGRGGSVSVPGQKSYMEMSQDERLALTPAQTAAATRAAMQGN